MKKRFIALALCVCTAFSMAACGKGKTDTKSSEGSIKLGEYKGYTVGESVTQVDSADVDEYINSILKMYSSTNDVKEGTTAEGDKVNVTYRATMNGESVEDSAEGKTQTDRKSTRLNSSH